jgi:hypothetical protein
VWTELDVIVVSDASATQVGVAESVKGAVAVMVAAAAIPSLLSAVRSKLYHAKRHAGTWMAVPMAAGTNKGVNVSSDNLCLHKKGKT